MARACLSIVPRRSRRNGRRSGRRAATTLEFALSASAFLGATAFLCDLGFVLYTQVALDFTASRAARMLAVDSQHSRSSSQAVFQAATVCPVLAAFLDCSQVSVALTRVSDYANASIPSTGPQPFDPGQGSSLMLLQLSYQLPKFVVPLAAAGVFAGTQTVARFPYINEY